MKIDKFGIWFKLNGYDCCYLWFWKRTRWSCKWYTDAFAFKRLNNLKVYLGT